MNKLKNSFAVGIGLGLLLSTILLVILDAIIWIAYNINGQKFLETDVIFAICTILNLLLARVFFRREEKQELGKGFLFAAFIWGVVYVYLFHITHIKTLFFAS